MLQTTDKGLASPQFYFCTCKFPFCATFIDNWKWEKSLRNADKPLDIQH